MNKHGDLHGIQEGGCGVKYCKGELCNPNSKESQNAKNKNGAFLNSISGLEKSNQVTPQLIERATDKIYSGAFNGISPAIEDNSYFWDKVFNSDGLEILNKDGNFEHVDIDIIEDRLYGNEQIHRIDRHIARSLSKNDKLSDSICSGIL